MPRRLGVLVLVTLLAAPWSRAHAACNLIPSATQTFRSSLGSTNKPYAAPGDFVEVGVNPPGCDVSSTGLLASGTQHDVTLVFTPPNGGQRRVVLLTADCNAAGGKISACESTPGIGLGNVDCEDSTAGLAIVSRNGIDKLSFRFPDTDALFTPDGDDRTLSGPVTIAVTNAMDLTIPCNLSTSTPCSAASGLIACVDDLYAADGSCAPNPHPTFTHFTALPVPNDYQADCFLDSPPCTALATDSRAAVDAAGNLLLPVNWQGILASQSNLPVPRLLRATFKSTVSFADPPTVSLGSFTPEGAPLPPIFEPQADDTGITPNVITLFGSADAAYTILRIARGLGSCTTGPNAGQACIDSRDCGGASCGPVCVGGTAPPNTPCTMDATCGLNGRCAALYADVRPLTANGGPLPLVRATPAFCQLDPNVSCSSNDDCLGPNNACVTYAFEARAPVALENLTQTSANVLAFTVSEPVAIRNLNGDQDSFDFAITLRNRATGASEPLGATPGCGITGTPEGRAVVQLNQTPFRYSAVATEDQALAFLESEAQTTTAVNPGPDTGCDVNGDGDTADSILRVFRLGAGEMTSGSRAVDAGLAINDRSLVISGGRAFFRTPEPAAAAPTTVRVSVAYDGSQANNYSILSPYVPSVSATGRFVVFESHATNLIPGGTTGPQHVFVHDRDLDGNGVFDEMGSSATTTEQADVPSGGGSSGPQSSFLPTISADGTAVAFETRSNVVLPGLPLTCPNGGGPSVCINIAVRDRVSGTTSAASVDNLGTFGNGNSTNANLSADGRFVVFQSGATNLVASDTNAAIDVFVHDRCVSHGVAVVPCAPGTTRVSLTPAGGQIASGGSSPSTSDDGRIVVFVSNAALVPEDANAQSDAYVRDRLAGTTELASTNPVGGAALGFIQAPSVSGDGRWVGFSKFGGGIPVIPGAYVHDRVTGALERVDTSSTGDLGNSGLAVPRLSGDGRFAGFQAVGSHLVAGDTNTCGGDPTPGYCPDGFVRDRLAGTTQRLTLTAAGGEAVNVFHSSISIPVSLSGDGRTLAFQSLASTLLGPGGDTNNFCDNNVDTVYDENCQDIFVRSITPATAASNDRSGDGDANDTILESLDVTNGMVSSLCPATLAAVADGRVAFLRPEASGATSPANLPLCLNGMAATGGTDLNGDGDTGDLVVHLWSGSGTVDNLGLAGTAVALSATHVAAIGGSGGTIQTRSISGGGWTDSGEPADSLQFCGNVVAFLQPVAGHHVLGLWDPVTGTPTITLHVAEEIVCNDRIVAFRTSEALTGTNLNDPPDPDQTDDVLQIWDIANGMVHNPRRAVTPCRLAACDPRLPYRVSGDTVKFLSFEPEQSFDLNDDGDTADLVILTYDIASDVVRVVGTPASSGDPLQGGNPTPSGGGGGTIYQTTGRCIENLGGSCPCTPGAFCDASTCKKDHGVCRSNDDCRSEAPCDLTRGIVPASPDRDGDGIPDHLDNCPDAVNGDQTDTDADGVGDECDLATCGDAQITYDEACDGALASACSGPCLGNCRCGTCNDAIPEQPRLKVLVKTRNEIGRLVAKAELPLSTFDAATPVRVRLADADSSPIADTQLASIPASGSSATKFLYKVTSDGLQKVLIKQKPTGVWQIVIRSKHWFTAAAADGTAAETELDLTIGTQCFKHAATLKVD